MEKTRIPRKMKKYLKKNDAYKFGMSMWHCLMCQKRWGCCGYDLHFCKKCENETYLTQ